jgi:hypothetical protein
LSKERFGMSLASTRSLVSEITYSVSHWDSLIIILSVDEIIVNAADNI